MSLTQRCHLLTIGVSSWVAVVAMARAGMPLSHQLGAVHAGIAASVAALAFLPRGSVRWLS